MSETPVRTKFASREKGHAQAISDPLFLSRFEQLLSNFYMGPFHYQTETLQTYSSADYGEAHAHQDPATCACDSAEVGFPVVLRQRGHGLT